MKLSLSRARPMGSQAVWRISLIIGIFVSSTVFAQEEVLPYLPETAAVKQNLLNSPGISSARSKRDAQRERARGIQAGHAEFTVRSNLQHRRAGPGDGRFTESTISVERPIRLWGKSAQDLALA
ncbi:MAG: hypothetical protein EBT08_01945, partial [Betaproteobacteria bacterium]|nr:hypothetical protein [Betaproteobacteria bacterium]